MEYGQNSDAKTEIIIGIVGAVGCNRELVISSIEKLAPHYSYVPTTIKVSDLIKANEKVEVNERDQYIRVMHLMDAGNRLRKRTDDNSILAKLVACEIHDRRAKIDEKQILYIIDSLKHPEEIYELRDIYGAGFYLLAVHSEEKQRLEFLEKYCHISNKDNLDNIVARDKDERIGHGQSTSKSFHLADFFVTEDGDHKKVWNAIERYLDLIFGAPFRTPTFHEYAMFMAHASSFRTADLSRQVGAVLTRDYSVISSGANECPSAFGGTYWPLFDPDTKIIYDKIDGRDYKRGGDHNALEKHRIREAITKNAPEPFREELSKNIDDSGLNDITEFGRVVHAEMDAILDCARRGESTLDASMFCTTFPCHNCAKHIIASGISTVFYIEPYPKSKAVVMHRDSLTTDKAEHDEKVLFRPFMGVGPRQFLNLFSMHISAGSTMIRKNPNGVGNVEWERQDAKPRVKLIPYSHREIELFLIDNIRKNLANQT